MLDNFLIKLCCQFCSNYGCEVWGYENNIVIATVFFKFCKYFLGLKTSTPNCMVYGERGTFPISFAIKVRLVSFWVKYYMRN